MEPILRYGYSSDDATEQIEPTCEDDFDESSRLRLAFLLEAPQPVANPYAVFPKWIKRAYPPADELLFELSSISRSVRKRKVFKNLRRVSNRTY